MNSYGNRGQGKNGSHKRQEADLEFIELDEAYEEDDSDDDFEEELDEKTLRFVKRVLF